MKDRGLHCRELEPEARDESGDGGSVPPPSAWRPDVPLVHPR